MYADGSIISNGDTLRFEYFEEDPIKFNAETKIELTLYNDKQIVDQRNYNINFNQSKKLT